VGRFAIDKKSKWGWEKLLEMWGRVILIKIQVGRVRVRVILIKIQVGSAKISMEV
jgi:hypothetical protein